MTTEELLKIRYKVIAEYPESKLKTGSVLNQWIGSNFVGEDKYIIVTNPQKYPAIFKELKWWQEREFEELPKYLKIEDAIRKVVKWDLGLATVFVTNGFSEKPRGNRISIYQPATEEEYLQFTNQKEDIK